MKYRQYHKMMCRVINVEEVSKYTIEKGASHNRRDENLVHTLRMTHSHATRRMKWEAREWDLVPLQWYESKIHSLFIRFVGVASPPVQCSTTGLKMQKQESYACLQWHQILLSCSLLKSSGKETRGCFQNFFHLPWQKSDVAAVPLGGREEGVTIWGEGEEGRESVKEVLGIH